MREPVRWVRNLEFCAGPQNHQFYACDRHKPDLDAVKVQHFFASVNKPTHSEPVNELDAETERCWFCLGEEGP
jgi:hypothetical protein